MKRRFTIAIDEEVVTRAKRYARSKGQSLSTVIEDLLREIDCETKHPQSSRKHGEGDSRPRRWKTLDIEN